MIRAPEMLRRARLGFFASSTLGLAAGACGTDAVAVTECREIEAVRCSLAKTCGQIEDERACLRYQRDQCLHGMKLDDAPKTAQVTECTDALEEATRCAEAGTDQSPRACGLATTGAKPDTTVCDLVAEVELLTGCQFLIEGESEPDRAEPDAGDASPEAGTDGGS